MITTQRHRDTEESSESFLGVSVCRIHHQIILQIFLDQKIANGLIGDEVPPGSLSGAVVNR